MNKRSYKALAEAKTMSHETTTSREVLEAADKLAADVRTFLLDKFPDAGLSPEQLLASVNAYRAARRGDGKYIVRSTFSAREI